MPIHSCGVIQYQGRRLRVAALCVAMFAASQFALLAQAADAGAQLDALARDTERVESLRAAKDLQYAYSQYTQFGLWNEVGELFASNGELVWGDKVVKGPAAIAKYERDTWGGGKTGLPIGAVNTLLVEVPLSNLSVDGNSAAARWYGMHLRGGGTQARWESGTFENEYVKEKGVWKIARLHFHPQFGGPYENGWRPFSTPLPRVPYHFENETIAGTPLPPATGDAPKTKATLASVEQRITLLNAQDEVRNLQYAWGYYIDRKMWDDVTDLFTADGVLELGGIGIYDGPASIRRALERDGKAGPTNGQLNDHPLFDTLVQISANGNEAQVRGIDLGMTGDFSKGTAFWSVSVFTNRFVKQGGVWKIREMRITPVMKTSYDQGWGKSLITDSMPAKEFAPDRAAASGKNAALVIPAFFAHPVTGKAAAYPAGARVVAKERLLKALGADNTAARGSDEARLTEARRKLALSQAYEGAANMTAAYTHYIDDSQWTSMGAIFAQQGNKEVPFNGYYIGPERIAHRPGAAPAANGKTPGGGGWHWLMQPVIHVAPDGRSAKMRSRLFHPAPNNNGGGMEGGMYPNNQAVLENGAWKLWTITIDEPYFTSQWPTGWSRAAAPRAAAAPRPAAAPAAGAAPAAPAARQPSGMELYPPDIPLTMLGKRFEGFAGGSGETIRWPGQLPMWFHYKNPVSGRMPPLYWPNCGTCEYAPQTSMDKHGYTLPDT